MKKFVTILIILVVTACGDFPSYRFEQSENYCVMKFPFAGGLIGRKYVGYVFLTSSLQYLDADPQVDVFIGGPSHIELETGSVHKLEIDGKTYFPKFDKSYLNAELQYMGPAFLFDKTQSQAIFDAYSAGNDLTVYGRLEVGKQYETDIYNFLYSHYEKPFLSCINRLMDEEDLKRIAERKAQNIYLTGDEIKEEVERPVIELDVEPASESQPVDESI